MTRYKAILPRLSSSGKMTVIQHAPDGIARVHVGSNLWVVVLAVIEIPGSRPWLKAF
jgi:hypothetical protein